MGILDGKKLLITGVLTDDSLAFSAAKRAQEEGAEIVLSGAGRALSLTQRIAKKLPAEPEVFELDVTNEEHLAAIQTSLDAKWGSLDGVLHAIAYAPPTCLGGDFLEAPWEDVSTALNVSAYSLKALTNTLLPLFDKAGGGSVVGLDFDATVAWPAYDWMGVSKAALESVARYLAREVGSRNVRVNLIAAGPIRTIAAKSIPGFDKFEEAFDSRAPLGWDIKNADPVGRACVALFSDLFPATTGEIIHVDGGYHAIGA
jgi:enoyl ACP reductase